MRKIILFILVVFFYCNYAKSQNFSLNYVFEGKNDKKSTFKSYENLIIGIEDSINSLIEDGYIDASVKKLIKTDSFDYQIELNRGVKLQYIKILNIEEQDIQIQNILNAKNREGLIKFEQFPDLINSCTKYLSNLGYPFSKVKLDKIKKIDSISVSAHLSTKLGKKREINKVIVKGYENFPKKFIKNLLGLRKNAVLKIDELKNRMNSLNRINFAKSIKDPEILFTNDSTKVYLFFEKIKKNTFDGFIGFNTDESNGKLKIQGNAKINLSNTFNQGESIKLDFLSEDDQERFLTSDVKIPYVFNSPFDVSTGIKLIQKDSIYNSRELFGELEITNKNFTGGAGVELTESSNEIPSSNVKTFKRNLYTLSVNYELSDFSEPKGREKMKIFLKYGSGHKIQSNVKSRASKIMIEIQRNFNISKKIKFNSMVLREKISSENIVTNELLRFGVIKSIRGFDENSIFTNEYTLLNTNLNFYINDTIYIYTLFDLANYRNNIFELNENIYAGGFGFSTTTQNGIISVNYAKGNQWGKKFNLKNAKLSVSFISYF